MLKIITASELQIKSETELRSMAGKIINFMSNTSLSSDDRYVLEATLKNIHFVLHRRKMQGPRF